MATSTATSKTSGSKFGFRYQVFSTGRNTMHSCQIEVGGDWRSADVMVMGEDLHGTCEWMEGSQRCEVKFVVSETEDTKRMVGYAKEDAAQYVAEKQVKKEASTNQETYIG